MKTPACTPLFALLLALPVGALPAADELAPPVRNPATHVLLGAGEAAVVAAVRAADDERVGAVLAADPTRLDAILSDQLVYTHSTGKAETKPVYMASLVSRQTVYETYSYQQRDFQVVSADIVLMTGRMTIKARSAAGAFAGEVSLLAVWRLEAGRWRFLAWQSARLAPPAGK